MNDLFPTLHSDLPPLERARRAHDKARSELLKAMDDNAAQDRLQALHAAAQRAFADLLMEERRRMNARQD